MIERRRGSNNVGLEFMYKSLGVMSVGFENMVKIVAAPFVLEAKLLEWFSTKYMGGGFNEDDRYLVSLMNRKEK